MSETELTRATLILNSTLQLNLSGGLMNVWHYRVTFANLLLSGACFAVNSPVGGVPVNLHVSTYPGLEVGGPAIGLDTQETVYKNETIEVDQPDFPQTGFKDSGTASASAFNVAVSSSSRETGLVTNGPASNATAQGAMIGFQMLQTIPTFDPHDPFKTFVGATIPVHVVITLAGTGTNKVFQSTSGAVGFTAESQSAYSPFGDTFGGPLGVGGGAGFGVDKGNTLTAGTSGDLNGSPIAIVGNTATLDETVDLPVNMGLDPTQAIIGADVERFISLSLTASAGEFSNTDTALSVISVTAGQSIDAHYRSSNVGTAGAFGNLADSNSATDDYIPFDQLGEEVIAIPSTPEPSGMCLLGAAVTGLGMTRLRPQRLLNSH